MCVFFRYATCSVCSMSPTVAMSKKFKLVSGTENGRYQWVMWTEEDFTQAIAGMINKLFTLDLILEVPFLSVNLHIAKHDLT